MIERLVGALFVAWVLSWFDVDELIVQGINDLFGTKLTVPAYYVIFAILGVAEFFVEKKLMLK